MEETGVGAESELLGEYYLFYLQLSSQYSLLYAQFLRLLLYRRADEVCRAEGL